MILDGLGMEVEVVDITAPGMKEATDFMRSNGKKKEGERNVLPPQEQGFRIKFLNPARP